MPKKAVRPQIGVNRAFFFDPNLPKNKYFVVRIFKI